jgi:hypothetical protein
MGKSRRAKYQIAVYGIVASLGVLLVLIALLVNDKSVWQSILVNLGTGLIGVVALFFLVDRFFLADEWSLSDRVDQLIKRLELSDRPSAKDFFIKPPALDQYIKAATHIDLCGMVLSTTLNEHFGDLRQQLQRGATIRLLVANPDSLALEMSALRSETPSDVDYYVQRLRSSFNDIAYLHRSWVDYQANQGNSSAKGGFAVRLLPYAPSFGVRAFGDEAGYSTVVVEVYPHGSGYTSKPVFVLTPERDGLWCDYFTNQFEEMWKGAIPWAPTESKDDEENFLRRRARHVRAADFLSTGLAVSKHSVANARVVCMAGFTLGRTTREYLEPLQRCLANGGSVRIMILAATDPLLEQSSLRSEGQSRVQDWRKRLDSTEVLVRLMAKTEGIKGVLELGHLPYTPSFGFLMIDPDTDHGVIIVELYHHRSARDNVAFELRRERDGEWYRFFREQFDLMWQSCQIEKLPDTAI